MSAYPNTEQSSAERKGKWTTEEEEYANYVVYYLQSGLLDLPNGGASVRTYVADLLRCDPMRVTKKFSGKTKLRIDKRNQFAAAQYHGAAHAQRELALRHLQELRSKFLAREQYEAGVSYILAASSAGLPFSGAPPPIPPDRVRTPANYGGGPPMPPNSNAHVDEVRHIQMMSSLSGGAGFPGGYPSVGPAHRQHGGNMPSVPTASRDLGVPLPLDHQEGWPTNQLSSVGSSFRNDMHESSGRKRGAASAPEGAERQRPRPYDVPLPSPPFQNMAMAGSAINNFHAPLEAPPLPMDFPREVFYPDHRALPANLPQQAPPREQGAEPHPSGHFLPSRGFDGGAAAEPWASYSYGDDIPPRARLAGPNLVGSTEESAATFGERQHSAAERKYQKKSPTEVASERQTALLPSDAKNPPDWYGGAARSAAAGVLSHRLGFSPRPLPHALADTERTQPAQGENSLAVAEALLRADIGEFSEAGLMTSLDSWYNGKSKESSDTGVTGKERTD